MDRRTPVPGSTCHTIRRQYLDVETSGTESDGIALQRSLISLSQLRLTPAIERTLDRFAPPDGDLCIERLEIDLGTMTPEGLERDFAGSVARALERTLRQLTLEVEQALEPSFGQGSTPRGKSPKDIPGRTRHRSTHRSIEEAFLHFLKTGQLPWSFHLPAGSTLEQVILECWRDATGLDAGRPKIVEAVRAAISSATIRTRLARQFSPSFLKTVLSFLSPRGEIVMDEVLGTLRALATSVDTRHVERLLWETAFGETAAGRVPSPGRLAGGAWRAFPVTAAARADLSRVLELLWPGATREDASDTLRPPGIPRPDVEELVDAREGLYIANSGLVLLHPFLPRFFAALGVASEDRLVRPDRALCLLHLLATGQATAPEYELTLPKILCNIPLEAAVDADATLTAADLEEASALLEAVIRHWTALRSTSAEGLRGAFLLRPGKVSVRGGEWLLEVESRTADILLDQLPWGISLVRLPWMEKRLWVEWR